MKESKIERYFIKECKKKGWLPLKFVSPSMSGLPDRMVLLPGGRVSFVELKAEGEKPTEHGKLLRTVISGSPLHGEAAPITASPDPAFAEKMMGDGAAIVPCEGVVTAPCDATVGFVFDTRHAIGLELEDGTEVMVHVGINTVALEGQGFTALVEVGDTVRKGEPILKFDLDYIREHATSTSTPVLITSMEDNQELRLLKTGHIRPGEDLLALDIYES